MAEDEMIGWHHQLNGHEFEEAPGVGDGQGGLACCSPWGHKESDTELKKIPCDAGAVGWNRSWGSTVENSIRFRSIQSLSCV